MFFIGKQFKNCFSLIRCSVLRYLFMVAKVIFLFTVPCYIFFFCLPWTQTRPPSSTLMTTAGDFSFSSKGKFSKFSFLNFLVLDRSWHIHYTVYLNLGSHGNKDILLLIYQRCRPCLLTIWDTAYGTCSLWFVPGQSCLAKERSTVSWVTWQCTSTTLIADRCQLTTITN